MGRRVASKEDSSVAGFKPCKRYVQNLRTHHFSADASRLWLFLGCRVEGWLVVNLFDLTGGAEINDACQIKLCILQTMKLMGYQFNSLDGHIQSL